MKSDRNSDVAIVGMSALFAGAENLPTYWSNILNKVNAVTEAPDERILPYYDPSASSNDRLYTRKGGFIHPLAHFNSMAFGIMPNAVEGGSPDQYLSLKLSQAALEDAGYGDRTFNRERTGVILGNGSYLNRGFGNIFQHGIVVDQTLEILQQAAPWLDAEILQEIRQGLKASLPPFKAEMCPGLIPNNVAGRVANYLDLMGPNYVLDGACASSLIAVKLGIDELLSRRCDMVLAGGVNASLQPPVMMLFTQLGALAHGDVSPFDATANGTLLGEGIGIVVLKRRLDAERDGDRIYAVIKGVGVASDGKGLSPVAPRMEGQRLALRRAYEESGIDPATVGLIEAHGTGIPLGDRTEMQTLGQVFGQRDQALPRLALGSVKSMVSHCITASGAAGLIKTALALYHKVLPPTLCDQVNPNLKIESSPFYINNQTRPWIHGTLDHPRRAGVNAFGFGGINSHALLEEYVPASSTTGPSLHRRWSSELVLLGADRRATLQQQVTELIQQLADQPSVSLADWAYTLAQTPTQGAYRLAIVADSLEDLRQKLASAQLKLAQAETTRIKTRSGLYYAEAQSLGPVAFLFPGEGAQYSNMLLDLCLYFPEVRQWFDLLDAALPAGFLSPQQPLPSAVVFPAPTALTSSEQQQIESWLMGMELGSATLFVAGMALYELLEQFGVRAAAMVGHSSGENTAVVASRHVTYESRSQLIETIAQLNQTIKGLEDAGQVPTGAMLAVGGIGAEAVRRYIDSQDPSLEIAVDNCANQTVLFGDVAPIRAAHDHFACQGGICRILPFDRAYHTSHFAPVSAVLREIYQSLAVQAGHTAVYSCVTAQPFPQEPEAIRDLMAAQWHSQVRFRETIEALYRQGFHTFVEVGPSGNLTAFVEDILRGQKHLALSSNSRHRSGLSQLQRLLAHLFVEGADLDVSPLYAQRQCQLVVGDRPDAIATLPKLELAIPRMELPMELVQRLQHQARTVAAPESGDSSQAAWPLLGEILEQNHQQLRCRRRFDLNHDCFLQDHVFGGRVSDHQPNLLPLPLLPLTFSLELLAEAASYLVGDLKVVGLRQIRAHRWLALERGVLTVEIEADLQATPEGQPPSVYVRLYSLEAETKTLAVEGEVQLLERFSPPPQARLALSNPQPAATTDAQIYGTGMFHGPQLQGIRHLRQWAKDGIEADLTTLPVHGFFRAERSPVFQLDPGLLDAAGQLVTYWLLEQFGANHAACFPFSIEAIELWAPPLPPHTPVLCRASIQFVNPQQIRADMELLGSEQQLVARIIGWQDIHYQGPANNFNGCRFNPRDEYLSEPLMQVETGSFCREIQPFSAFLEASSGIWRRMLAHLMLNQAERDVWYALPEKGDRRTEWLLGRIAAKDAVRQWASQVLNINLAPADVEIAVTAQGKPYALCPFLGEVAIPEISISHSQGHAIAALAPQCGIRIGVDCQAYQPAQATDWLDSALTPQEQTLTAQASPEQRYLATLGIWCAKESAAKTAGTGLLGQPQRWQVSAYSPELDQLTIVNDSQLTFSVRLWYTHQHVLALCQA